MFEKIAKLLKNEKAGSAEIRQEFGSLERYVAYRRGIGCCPD